MLIAKRDFYAEDAVGVRRLIKAGTQVPPDIDIEGQEVESVDPTATGPVADLPAREGAETYVEDALGVRRMVAAGDKPPPGIDGAVSTAGVPLPVTTDAPDASGPLGGDTPAQADDTASADAKVSRATASNRAQRAPERSK